MGCKPDLDDKQKKILFISLGAIAIATVIIVPIAIEVSQDKNAPRSTIDNRIECYPFKNMTKDTCAEAGCLWEPATGQPSCFLPDSKLYGYEINSVVNNLPENKGFSVDLRRRRPFGNDTVAFSLYGGDYDEVTFEVVYHTDNTLSFALYPKGTSRESWRPPIASDYSFPSEKISSKLYTVELASSTVGEPFNFLIKRASSKAILFDTSLGGLTLAEQFLMISTALPTQYLYGLGENTHDDFLHDMKYRMWPIFTRDVATIDDDTNLYGAHPFYMVAENDGSSHGVFFFNSHAMDVTTMPNPGLTFRTIGGMLEFLVFLGPEPETVVQQYTAVIGRPAMPPYFALGFQICRWGYTNTQDIRDVIDRTRSSGIPHDVQWADIDYMDGKKDFTIDEANFGDLPALVDEIKQDGLRFIIILDPAIAVDENYTSYLNGLDSDAYVKWANDSIKPQGQDLPDNILMGAVWPGATVFPDFFKNSTVQWWTREITEFHQQLKFDALWIDMNEVSCFDTNVYPNDATKLSCPQNKWDDPPYETLAAYTDKNTPNRLSDKTICMVAQFGEAGKEYLHYDVHSLYGYTHARATHQALTKLFPDKRSMVLSRSTYPGSGKYTFHWLGDNFSAWSNMAASIIGMMEFNMFGIPYVGADVCGFIGDTTEELCERWMELGAFYPFSRNHNNIDAIDQDPGLWPNTVAASGRKALMIRYRLLPYLYTLFYEAHTTGSTVIRPLYHEFRNDVNVKSIDKQFLWGPAFMISPVLEEGKTSVDVYFPDDGIWYDYYTGMQVMMTGNVTLEAPRDHINLHIRGGYILPAQKPAFNTMLSRKNNFELIVALDANKAAKGKFFWDDGESRDTVKNKQFYLNTYEFKNRKLTISTSKADPNLPKIDPKLGLMEILGWDSQPSKVSFTKPESTEPVIVDPSNYTYFTVTKKLQINGEFDMNSDYTFTLE